METETLVAGLPEDIQLFQILPLMPTKALCRFKCVCKRWQSAISDIVRCRSSSLAYIRGEDHHLITATEIGHSETGISLSLPRNPLYLFYLVTACNGMLLWGSFAGSTDWNGMVFWSSFSGSSFFVFNLRTQEWSPIPTNIRFNIGLIFDPSVSEHYKLVWPSYCSNPGYLCFQVFSSNTGKWSLSGAKIPSDETLDSPMNTAFIDGILFWKGKSHFFMWFDHEKDNAGIEALPGKDRVTMDTRGRFGEWDGMLTLHQIADGDIEIWIMHNKVRCFQWAKMFSVSFSYGSDLGFNRFHRDDLYPLPYVGGEILMFEHKGFRFRDLFSFNIKTKELLKFQSSKDHMKFFDTEYFVYKKSHFSY